MICLSSRKIYKKQLWIQTTKRIVTGVWDWRVRTETAIEQKPSSFSLAKFFVPSYNGEKKGRRIENDTTRDFCKEFGYLR